ncbi:MAG: hypothetical protein ACREPM_08815 [Gemmatimonadaceae bacterium]
MKANRVQPDLGAIGIALNVNVRRLVPIAGEEEAPVRADAKDGGHLENYSAHGLEPADMLCCHITPELTCGRVKQKRMRSMRNP